ncbi:BMP family ABC transporter substrate-binding protein [Neobacillus piezotolerans]|uniref:BMP family ABC transporter substrate-binding protein n=1 Tax=Neobacillus piezotolerans TaxID=2259171 RepID=A0A3D8GKB5_9BACI|nr:BMP family ABC transporter substrate-binding protein [Neobacillus piezotolerans]RDU34737.1 BMP family ABC transporter substrate-binding protein [Neobacillus piezotolerans]
MTKVSKKLALVLFIALMTVVMAACGNSADKEKEANAGSDKDGLKIAIVTSPSGVDDGSFNEDNYNGILSFIEKHPDATVKAVKEETGDPAAAVQAVADIVADYDVIVTPGFQFAGVSSIAVENPDKMFILNDSEPAPVGDQKEFDNIYAMNFAEQESGFFAGMAAALETKTNKVAVVNGIAYPSNVNYQFGFESGVNYANKVFGKKVELVELSGYAGTDVTGADVGGNYAGSFADEATGKVIGNALIKQGTDIIFVAAGGTGNGVFTAVKEAKNDVKVIGVDVDQFDDGKNGSENIVLTSAVKFMSMNIEKTLNSVVDGSFKGGNVVLYADTDSTGFIKEEGRHQLSEDTLNKLNEAYKLVQDGAIVPASNFNGHTPEKFPGL